MSTPKRIQRKRTKGWRMPEGAVVVTRPTRWGNPYLVDREPRRLTADEAVGLYRLWLTHVEDGREIAAAAREELADKDLACWCPLGQPCHADVLLDIANRPRRDRS